MLHDRSTTMAKDWESQLPGGIQFILQPLIASIRQLAT